MSTLQIRVARLQSLQNCNPPQEINPEQKRPCRDIVTIQRAANFSGLPFFFFFLSLPSTADAARRLRVQALSGFPAPAAIASRHGQRALFPPAGPRGRRDTLRPLLWRRKGTMRGPVWPRNRPTSRVGGGGRDGMGWEERRRRVPRQPRPRRMAGAATPGDQAARQGPA